MSMSACYADQVEAIFNVHPEVARTALVGIGSSRPANPGAVRRTACIRPNAARRHRIRTDLLQLGHNHAVSKSIQQILFHKSFPVDIRHNAKIGQGKTRRLGSRETRMRILVTGGGGFLGSAICRQLLARGDEVIAYQRSAADELGKLGAQVVQG